MSCLRALLRPFVLILSIMAAGAWLAPAAVAQKIAPPPPERWMRPQLVIPSPVETPVRLQQVAQGNNFRLRVYPIPALGVKQVVLRYSETLRSRNGRLIYRALLDYAATLDSFRLDLNVTGALTPPVAASGALDEFAFRRVDGGFHAQVSRERSRAWAYRGGGTIDRAVNAAAPDGAAPRGQAVGA